MAAGAAEGRKRGRGASERRPCAWGVLRNGSGAGGARRCERAEGCCGAGAALLGGLKPPLVGPRRAGRGGRRSAVARRRGGCMGRRPAARAVSACRRHGGRARPAPGLTVVHRLSPPCSPQRPRRGARCRRMRRSCSGVVQLRDPRSLWRRRERRPVRRRVSCLWIGVPRRGRARLSACRLRAAQGSIMLRHRPPARPEALKAAVQAAVRPAADFASMHRLPPPGPARPWARPPAPGAGVTRAPAPCPTGRDRAG